MQKIYYRDWRACRNVPFAYVVSRIAAPISLLHARFGVKPNHITAAAGATGLVAVACAFSGAWGFASAALLAFLVLDHVDGQVARHTDDRTILGGYLDTLVDLSVDVMFLGALATWGILHDTRTALIGLLALTAYVGLELVNRHGNHTLILEALRAGDFTSSDDLPTFRGAPVLPHRDLNILVLVAGLATGMLLYVLAALTLWWSGWALYRIGHDVHRPKDTRGVLLDLMQEDVH